VTPSDFIGWKDIVDACGELFKFLFPITPNGSLAESSSYNFFYELTPL
jgi:hypothetical protein